ncbi:MAG: hypothetical protein FJY95_11745 [Candidatus Handelsmanbacteria bacterium]|nr:hypothetical protein [Candidatus Handelsmanbacteria bacterium]
MQISAQDQRTLRQLAERYSELAHLGVQQERIERYYQTNALAKVRPVVLISEVPWGEIRDEALANTCAPELGWLETPLRCALYQWDHFQVDLVIPPLFDVGKQIRSSSIGLAIDEVLIKCDTGAYIAAHEYHDILQTDEDLEKLHPPESTYDREATAEMVAMAEVIFAGMLPVKAVGVQLQYSIRDQISQYRGVEKLLYDLAVRPEFWHRLALRFTDIALATFRQYRDLDLLYPSPFLLHRRLQPRAAGRRLCRESALPGRVGGAARPRSSARSRHRCTTSSTSPTTRSCSGSAGCSTTAAANPWTTRSRSCAGASRTCARSRSPPGPTQSGRRPRSAETTCWPPSPTRLSSARPPLIRPRSKRS